MKAPSWQLFGLFIDHCGTALVHCPSCGHQLQDDLGLQLLIRGEQRWPIQGSQLICPSCKSTGAVNYAGWAQAPTLPGLWQEIIAGLELPSTRMLLVQQGGLLGVDDSTVRVGVRAEWMAMAQSRLPLLEAAVGKILPNRKVLLLPTPTQSAAAPHQLLEAAAIPPAENHLHLVPAPVVVEHAVAKAQVASVVVTELEPELVAVRPAAGVQVSGCAPGPEPGTYLVPLSELMVRDEPAPAPVAAPAAVELDVPVFDRSEAPVSRCIDGEVRLTLSSWKRLRPDLGAELSRSAAVHQVHLRQFGEPPAQKGGSCIYGADRLAACLHALTGVVVEIRQPKWRIREDGAAGTQTNAAA